MRKHHPLIHLIAFGLCIFAEGGLDTAKAGFTGPGVPSFSTMNGDLDITGAMLPNYRADIPKLVKSLQRIQATDFFHVIQPDNSESWNDFQLMAPAFQQAGIKLWAYLFPHGLSAPFNNDYVAWGQQIATLSSQYSTIAGIAIDDFSSNTGTFTTSYCRSIMNAAHAIDPDLALLATTYYDQRTRIASHVRNGAIDGVLFPYRVQQNETDYFQDTSQLAPQLSTFRSYLDLQTTLGGLSGKMPLVTMVYANPLSYSTDAPTPSYVQTCLEIGRQQTAAGKTNGVMTYELEKDETAFMQAFKPAAPVTLPFRENFQSVAPSGDAFLDYPAFTATGDQPRWVNSGGVLLLGSGPVPAADFFTVTPIGYAPGSELVIKIDMGFAGQAGSGGAALRLGENTIVFHPGYNSPPGAFRVEGGGGFGNQNMTWIPLVGVLHHVEIHSLPSGLFSITITDGTNPSRVYTTSFTNPASYGGEIGPAAIGTAAGIFDNFSIQSYLVPGDFNNSGTVDTADYLVWRKGFGTLYSQTDYNVWRAHFGQTVGNGAGTSANTAVPEPAASALLMFTAAGWWLRRGGARRNS